MIDIRKLKELVKLMVENDLGELDLRDSEEQVTVRRGGPAAAQTPHVTYMPSVARRMRGAVRRRRGSLKRAPRGSASAGGSATAIAEDAEADDLIRIESPMVGTFYSAGNPDAPPFAAPGSAVTPDKVVCIIEAMKIFNEIKAECTGTIHKVLVKSGEAVEFGQTLFLVKPG